MVPIRTLVKTHLETQDYEQLQRSALENDRSVAAEVRVAIRFYLMFKGATGAQLMEVRKP